MESFINKEPASAQWFKLWYGADEFINNRPRWCLWLKHCPLHQLRQMPLCLERIEKVREYRLQSPSAGTRKLADDPLRFHVENFPKSNYLAIPKVSSEQRRYIPMGFMEPDVLCSDLLFVLHNASLYHFGVMSSNVHMAWMRAIGGRLEMRYRYSIGIVYNNFPWPNPTPKQKAQIEASAQAILDARKKCLEDDPKATYADLYDDMVMPYNLKQAHRKNDAAVMNAYGFKLDMTEPECITALIKLYNETIENKNCK